MASRSISIRLVLPSAVLLAALQTAAAQSPAPSPVLANAQAPAAAAGGSAEAPIVASGTVGDEATKTAILGRLREVYGASRVVDNLAVANVLTPPNWSGYVQKLISPALKNVSHGELAINGSNVAIRGEVATEVLRQQLVSDMATQLNTTYVVKNGLHVGAAPQSVLDDTLANRTIEFESASAVLTDNGRAILDQMVAALKSVGAPKLELIGHTDASGIPEKNLLLSQARAAAVKTYLVGAGLDAARIASRGVGAAGPVASNATPEGRARNRRIEFKVVP